MPLVCWNGRCFADRRETVCQPCLWDVWESVGNFKEHQATPPGRSGRPREARGSPWDVRAARGGRERSVGRPET